MIESIGLSRRGEVEGAKSKLTAIRIPRFRWEALVWIASALKESASGEFWLATLLEARLVGMEMVQWTMRLVAGALPANERRQLVREFKEVPKCGPKRRLADQYESLRASTDPAMSERCE